MGSQQEENQLQIPILDFSELDPTTTTGQLWDSIRCQVMDAIKSYGCFQVIYNKVGLEVKEDLFGQIEELFSLPVEVKKRNNQKQFGYIGQVPGTVGYESLKVNRVAVLEGVQEFTDLMWPQGNSNFCNTVWTYTNHMQKLAGVTQRMILQSLGVEKHYDSHIDLKTSGLRLSTYGAPVDEMKEVALLSHTDPNMLTIVCQHQINGLEVQLRDGQWSPVVSLPNSFTVMIGESFRVLTNGILQPPYHRVTMIGQKRGYSALFSTLPTEDFMLQPLKEFVGDGHPLLFKDFDYKDFLKFRYSGEDKKFKDGLVAYCGVETEVKA